MVWCRPGDKLISEPMVAILLVHAHIYIYIYIHTYIYTHTHIHTHTYHSASMRLKSNFKHALKVESRSRRPPSIHRLHPRMSIVDSLVWCQRIQDNHRDHPHPSACVVCKTIIFTKSFRNQQVAVISIHERVTEIYLLHRKWAWNRHIR